MKFEYDTKKMNYKYVNNICVFADEEIIVEEHSCIVISKKIFGQIFGENILVDIAGDIFIYTGENTTRITSWVKNEKKSRSDITINNSSLSDMFKILYCTLKPIKIHVHGKLYTTENCDKEKLMMICQYGK